jgi:hypothetical protein
MVHFFFIGHKNVQVGSRFDPIRNKLASWIRIRRTVLRLAEPEPKEIFTDPQHWCKMIPYYTDNKLRKKLQMVVIVKNAFSGLRTVVGLVSEFCLVRIQLPCLFKL